MRFDFRSIPRAWIKKDEGKKLIYSKISVLLLFHHNFILFFLLLLLFRSLLHSSFVMQIFHQHFLYVKLLVWHDAHISLYNDLHFDLERSSHILSCLFFVLFCFYSMPCRSLCDCFVDGFSLFFYSFLCPDELSHRLQIISWMLNESA